MFVLIVGCGRVGSAIAHSMLAEGHEVSVLDEDSEAIALLERGQTEGWEERGGRFTEGTALEIDALLAAGIDQADAFVASTDGDNTNLVIALLAKQHEITVVESDPVRFAVVEQELEHSAHYGDGSELWVLERAGIERADLVVAVTGDDEDNILISQVAREKYGVTRVVARCNNPRNLQHFELLGVKPAISATDLILRLIEHEVPKYGLVHLLDLPEERLEIIELEVDEGCAAAGRRVRELGLPDGSLVISVLRDGAGFVPNGDSVVQAGDEVLLVLDVGLETSVTERFADRSGAAA